MPYLSYDWTNDAVQGFDIGSIIKIQASAEVFIISSPSDSINFKIGTFDRSGPVSDGPSSHTNKYVNDGDGFISAHDKILPTDNPGSGLVISKTEGGLLINFDDVRTCVLQSKAANPDELQFFTAGGIKIKILDDSTPTKTQVKISYERPCWSKFMTINATKVLENSIVVEGSFTNLIGVVLREVNSRHTCRQGEPSTFTESSVLELNTNAPEGLFLGFKKIKSETPLAR